MKMPHVSHECRSILTLSHIAASTSIALTAMAVTGASIICMSTGMSFVAVRHLRGSD